jgi:GNAT superfamily N-acetyltransferase
VTPDAAALTRLVAAALPDEDLTAADLETCCFGPDTEVLGDATAAAVLLLRRFDDSAFASLLLLAVHPDAQRRGLGRGLVHEAAARARAAGAADLHLASAMPRYVWPGVDFAHTAALALFESEGFEPYGAACNMGIATSFRAAPPAGVVVEREQTQGAADLARREYPAWVDEVERGTTAGGCFVARADSTTIGFACHSVNRHGWIGPMATDPQQQRGGVGNALLAAVCADLEARGEAVGDIAWVGPIGFYAKAGARVSRVFRNARLML